MTDPGRAYLERLRVAVDVRLADGGWAELAGRADAAVAGVERGQLSGDEQLLHAAAHAMAGSVGRPDAAEVAALAARRELAEEDVPFAAAVLAARRDLSASARRLYAAATRERPALAGAVVATITRAFPPDHARALGDVVDAIATRWPDLPWLRAVRALEAGDDDTLARLALAAPALATGLEHRLGARLRATGAWSRLLDADDAEPAAQLRLLAGAVAWRRPIPAAAAARLARLAPAAPGLAAALLLGCGDVTAAARALPWPSGLLAIGEDGATSTLAQLARNEVAVQALWRTARDADGPGRWLAIAMFALELADRAALRQAATHLAPYAATAWGRVLAARIHLGAGEPGLALRTLGAVADDDPVAGVLAARADLADGRADRACAALAAIAAAHPGWTEARWRHGAALAEAGQVDAALAVLEAAPPPGGDCAILGPPATARAGALLTAAELHRRAGRVDLVEPRVRAALDAAPSSPMALRRACTIAVAIRHAPLADETHRRLHALVPDSRIADQLLGGVLELRGDVDDALVCYDHAGAWDRALILRGAAAALPAKLDLADARSVAALHAVAVAAVREDKLELAGDALVRAIERRPTHAGLRDDLTAVRLAQAAQAVRTADEPALQRSARDLRSSQPRTQDPRLTNAFVAVVVRLIDRSIAAGRGSRAGVRLEGLSAHTGDPRVAVHRVALAVRNHEPDAASLIPACGDDDHAGLLAGLATGDPARLRDAAASADPRVAAAARLALQLTTGDVASIAADVAAARPIELLGADAVLLAAAALAGHAAPTTIATWLDRVAGTLAEDARRVRLAAASLRVVDGPLALDDLDLDDLDRDDERACATAIVAIETRRRRIAGDVDGAHRGLGLLATLRGASRHVGLVALASLEDAAEAALAAWRGDPSDLDALQTAAAVLLRRAIERETSDRGDDACVEAWEAFLAAAGPLLASDDAWRELAARRGRIVPQELALARDHCEARIADVLARLGKHHRDRSTSDGVDAGFRLARVDTLRTTEVAVARALHALGRAGHDLGLALPLGPLGLDAHELRADVIAALAALSPRLDDDERGPLQIAQGLLGGALVDGWLELASGNLDEAERLGRGGLRQAGDDAVRLLAAVWQRRIHDALVAGDTPGAVAHAVVWAGTGAGLLPDDLARQMIAALRRYFASYGLSRTRRALGQIRAGHDVLLLRGCEVALILEHVDRRRAAIDPEERFALLADACALGPDIDHVQQRLLAAGRDLLDATPGPATARRVLAAIDKLPPIRAVGHLIDLARAREASRDPAAPRGRLRWDDDGEPRELELGVDTTIGRHPDCTIQLLQRIVGKEHARILYTDGKFTIYDLDSHGGVFVNGDRVQVRRLAPGDQIRIGATMLELE